MNINIGHNSAASNVKSTRGALGVERGKKQGSKKEQYEIYCIGNDGQNYDKQNISKIKDIELLLENDKCYCFTNNNIINSIFFGYLTHSKNIKDFIILFQKFMKDKYNLCFTNNDYKYAQNNSNNNLYSFVIPKWFLCIDKLKEITTNFNKYTKNNTINTNIYEDKKLYFPNQTTDNKSKYVIKKGKIRDFIIYNILNKSEDINNIKYVDTELIINLDNDKNNEILIEKEYDDTIVKLKNNSDSKALSSTLMNKTTIYKKMFDDCYKKERFDQHESWSIVGMALKNSPFNNDDAFSLFNYYSSKGNNYEGIEKTEKKFNLFNHENNTDNKYTIASICYFAMTDNEPKFFEIMKENTLELEQYDICKYIKLLAGKRFIYAYNKSEVCLYCYDGKLWRCDDVLLKQYISTELFNFLKTISYGLYYEHKSYSVITNRIKKLKDADFKNKLVKTYREVNENLEIKFDFKWYLLGFTNKVYDLQEGIMRDYRYDDYMVSTTGYSWRDPTIDEIQVIKNIIKQIMPIDNERELFLQILCTALDGKNLEKICLFNAPGGNGKSLINDLLIHSLGNYAIVGNNAILFEPSKTTSNPEKSNIHKKRLVVFREPPESKKFENSILKELSGGGNYSSRTHYETESKKELNCTIIIECNKKPLFAEEPTNAETRRIIDLVFRTQYTDDISKINPDKHIYKANTYYKSYEFKEKYKFALIYILMKEYNKYKDNNFELVVPDIIKERTQQYLEKSFNIIEWFKENYVLTNNKNNICKMIDLYHEFSSSDFYINFTKAEKRRYNKSYFNNFITSHEFFKEYYCERNGNIRNCIIKWKKIA